MLELTNLMFSLLLFSFFNDFSIMFWCCLKLKQWQRQHTKNHKKSQNADTISHKTHGQRDNCCYWGPWYHHVPPQLLPNSPTSQQSLDILDLLDLRWSSLGWSKNICRLTRYSRHPKRAEDLRGCHIMCWQSNAGRMDHIWSDLWTLMGFGLQNYSVFFLSNDNTLMFIYIYIYT